MRHYDLSDLRVLVLDDNKHFLSIMRAILRHFGVAQVCDCTDAFTAFELLKSTAIDLAFVDLRMPELDGFEFVSLVRNASDSPNKMLPIVMVSAEGSRAMVQKAINIGIEGYLVKPVRPIDVHNRIVTLIEHPHRYVRTQGGYFGPDRRRRADENFKKNERRKGGEVETIDPKSAVSI